MARTSRIHVVSSGPFVAIRRAVPSRDSVATSRAAAVRSAPPHSLASHTHTHTLHQAHLLLSPLASTGTVPDEIKSELLQKIRRFAEAQS